ncbi:MAG TPA: DUF1697 domain-containing protein [Clostridia bacterium]|nr:DUF1697 domain-containing protein [Clostridia bacterium]
MGPPPEGKGIISMAGIKEALVTLGLSDVRTYINSGNVIFEQHTGMAIKVLVMDHKTRQEMVDAILRNWVDDKTMRTYVLLLWKELDDRQILDRLPFKPGVDELSYTPGAVVWRVDRENVGRSQMKRIVGTPLYKKITIRSANTMRKLNELTATRTRGCLRQTEVDALGPVERYASSSGDVTLKCLGGWLR